MLTNRSLPPHAVATLSLRLILIGTVSGFLLLLLQVIGVTGLRPFFAGIGATCSLFGAGFAGWFSIRRRDRGSAILAAGSLLPLAFWAWVIYERVYGQYTG